jgi:hypothetical protein
MEIVLKTIKTIVSRVAIYPQDFWLYVTSRKNINWSFKIALYNFVIDFINTWKFINEAAYRRR